MATVVVTERINAPSDQIFEVMTDIQSWPENISGITEVQVISGPQTLNVGTRWKETRIMFGKQATEEMEVTEFEQNRRYVVESESCGSHFRTEFKFIPVDNYTTDVKMEMVVKANSMFAKLMSPLGYFLRGTIVKCLKQDFDDARKVCEMRYTEETSSSVAISARH